MRREILVSASAAESRVALLENDTLVEFMFDRPDQDRLVGDVYLGRVEAVLPGIQASFVDIGTEKAGFLHVSDILMEEDEEDDGAAGGRRNGRRRKRKLPPIQDLIRKGDEVVVQVTKEPIGTKGPRLTKQVSLPGRFLVYMPFATRVGVSRKIEGRDERSRLRKLARQLLTDEDGGVIIRTVGEDFNRTTFEAELGALRSRWQKIRDGAQGAEPPQRLHEDAKLTSGVIRDLFSDKFERLTVDSRALHQEIVDYLRGVDPDLTKRVHLYEGDEPLFDKRGIEEEIQKSFDRKVDLPSGGHIVIEPTEALVSIDVNTGRFTGKGRKDPEETIVRTNLDAAREIARQLRLRDIGGIVVCDFIDMESQKNRDKILHELRSHLGRDRARTKTFQVSDLGLIEMTRQRVRPSLFQALTEPCSQCGGKGRVYSPPSVLRRIERALTRIQAEGKERRVLVRTHPEVVLYQMESEPGLMKRLVRRSKMEIRLMDDPLLNQDEFRLLAGPSETDVTQKYVAE